jgi:hypothetical protein
VDRRAQQESGDDMLTTQLDLLAQTYVEERLDEAARERMLRRVEREYRAQRQQRETTLRARMGRTLVRVGQRLEAAATA